MPNTTPDVNVASCAEATTSWERVDAPSVGRLPRVRMLGVVLVLGAWSAVPAWVAQTPLVTRGPYLQRGSTTSIVVRWRTDMPTDSRVLYGPAPESLLWGAADAPLTTEHEVVVSGLVGGATYFYGVGTTAEILAGGDADHFFVTPPAVGTARPTRIWVTADAGVADEDAASVRDAYRSFSGGRYTDIWLMLGDEAPLAVADTEPRHAAFDSYPDLLRQTVLWPTLGAADVQTTNTHHQTGRYFDLFTLPSQGEAGGVPSGTEACYAFDYGDIHVIALDSTRRGRAPNAPMLAWLRDDLTQNLKPWVIAFWHHPPYSKGSHDSDSEPALVEMRATVLPILEAGGVDLVLSSHSRSYERSVLLDGHYGASDTLTETMKVDPGDGRQGGTGAYHKLSPGPAQHEGAVYVVMGGSSQTGTGPLDHPTMVTAAETPGSLVLDVDGNRLDATFLDATGGGARRVYAAQGPAGRGGAVVACCRLECRTKRASPDRAAGWSDRAGDRDPGGGRPTRGHRRRTLFGRRPYDAGRRHAVKQHQRSRGGVPRERHGRLRLCVRSADEPGQRRRLWRRHDAKSVAHPGGRLYRTDPGHPG